MWIIEGSWERDRRVFWHHAESDLSEGAGRGGPCKGKKVDFILAVGGGSVIDCCKIIAAHGREWYTENRKGNRFSGTSDRASAGRLY